MFYFYIFYYNQKKMDIQNHNCSHQDHKEIASTYYCQESKVYMYNKCQIFHNKLLNNHHIFNLDKNKDLKGIFSEYCQGNNHFEILNFYRKNHRKLWGSSCICKIERKDYGSHSKCDVCNIEDITEEMKKNLKDNINQLELLSKGIIESINKLKIIYEKINSNKEKLKEDVQKIFTKIRNSVNNREDEILLEIDKYLKEDLIKKAEKLPIQINLSLEIGINR